MKELIDRINREAAHLGNGVIKVDSFINHQVDPQLTQAMGQAFIEQFQKAGVGSITRILTAEISGIAPALATANEFEVPLVFARKHQPITMTGKQYVVESVSPTKQNRVTLRVAAEYLTSKDSILIIDDFLSSARTVIALVEIIRQSKATLAGVGCVIEKVYAGGRERLTSLNVPVITLAKIDIVNEQIVLG